jgi:crotonobetainyl-CoA:carnitine CoA-transferase CaiB-like acyl-CoA transferase
LSELAEDRVDAAGDRLGGADVPANLPLQGVRVLDFSTVLLGPYCTKVLAQYGADVVKVEAPDGDISRRLGQGRSPDMSSLFLNFNHGKRSIVLDLKSDLAKSVLEKLIKWADILVHNMRADAAARIGLSYEQAQRWNPAIVYAAASGFGTDGPYGSKRAYDDIIQGVSGVAAVQSTIAGRPMYAGSAVADKQTAMVCCSAILAALLRRERTGEGSEIDVPMFESMVEYVCLEHLGGWTFDPPIGAPLYPRTSSPDRTPFATADGVICAVIYNDRDWKRLLTAVERAELLTDSRLASMSSRTENTAYAYGLLQELFRARTTEEWLKLLAELDIPATKMNSIEDLFVDPHLRAVGMFADVEHPTEGSLRVPQPSVRFDGTRPPLVPRPAPPAGWDSRSVLADIGFTEEDVAALTESGVVVATSAV